MGACKASCQRDTIQWRGAALSAACWRAVPDDGPAFNAEPFDPTKVVLSNVGMATFTFSDGNNASFAYTVNGHSQAKAITRQVFQTLGTVCQ